MSWILGYGTDGVSKRVHGRLSWTAPLLIVFCVGTSCDFLTAPSTGGGASDEELAADPSPSPSPSVTGSSTEDSGAEPATEASPSPSSGAVASDTGVWATRDIDYFRTNPSDRFVVDPANVRSGHPYLGKRISASITQPHAGAHLYYDNATWPRGGTAPENYPAIYAVADAKILSVEKWWGMGPTDPNCRNLNEYRGGAYSPCYNHPDGRCGDIRNLSCPAGNPDPTACTSSVACSVTYPHYKYNIMMQIGTHNSQPVTFSYSIEPFVTPRDPVTGDLLPRFYEPFIKVQSGQIVQKGDILAHHYLVAGASGAHIHYQVNRTTPLSTSTFASPSIFNSAIIDQLRPTWINDSLFSYGSASLCMGIYLDASEVPFPSLDPEADGADCL